MALVQTHTGQDARKLAAVVPHTISSLALCRRIQNLTIMCTYILLHDTTTCIIIPISQMKKLMLILNDLHMFLRPITKKKKKTGPGSQIHWLLVQDYFRYVLFKIWIKIPLPLVDFLSTIQNLDCKHLWVPKKYPITAQLSSQ